jgi:hypothetical protein
VIDAVRAINALEAKMVEANVARRTLADKYHADMANLGRLGENTQADLSRAIATSIKMQEKAVMNKRRMVIIEREIDEKLKWRREDLREPLEEIQQSQR